MSEIFSMAPLRELLIRSNVQVEIKPEECYKQITVRLWGKGVILRGETLGTDIEASKQFLVKAGQFILSKIDARNGALGLIPGSLDGAIVSSDFPVFTLNSSRIVPKFLDWMSKTNAFVNICKAASEGTTNRIRIKEDRFLATEIPLPPLEEQQHIVARIEELAAKIEEARGLRRKAIEERELLKGTAANTLFLGRTEISLPLRDLVTVSGGGTPSKSNPFFWEGTIPWISPKDMKGRDISDAIDHISEQAIIESSAKVIDPGAVLIVVRGMILLHTVPSAILRVPAAINQDMKALIPNEKLLPEYLRSGLWALNKELLNLVEKSTHDTRKLETPKLLAWKIPVPPLSEQQRIVTYLDELQSQIDRLERIQAETSAELDALLPSILDKAFKGEL